MKKFIKENLAGIIMTIAITISIFISDEVMYLVLSGCLLYLSIMMYTQYRKLIKE